MADQELILGVMATQAGFATSAQVMEAAAAVLIEKDGTSLLERLETTGVLTPERRALLEAMAAAALADLPASLGAGRGLRREVGLGTGELVRQQRFGWNPRAAAGVPARAAGREGPR